MALHVAHAQRSQEWHDYRRTVITASDLPVILGLSPYRCEADLADEKTSGIQQTENIRMRVGQALEPLIASEYERATGKKIRRFTAMLRHPTIEWAAASPDGKVQGERRLVELKKSYSRTRFVDGLPQDVEAQVTWQMGVAGYREADVAVLMADEELKVIPITFDETTFDNLVVIAEDFRRRLAAGGPFSRDLNRIRRDHPADDGSEMTADDDLIEAAHALVATRGQIAALELIEERLKTAIQDRMGDAAYLIGPDFRATWKRTKDREETDWKSLATSLLRLVPEPDRAAIVGIHSSVRAGMRPFRLVQGGSDD